MNPIFKRAIVVCALSVFSTSGVSAASRNSADLLEYIPADSPYVLASLEPIPAKVADRLEPSVDGILKAYQRVLRYAMAEQLVKMSAEEEGAEQAEVFRGVAEELLNLMSIEGMRSVGVARNSAFAFYGNGLLPVLRLELSDPDLFDAAIVRIEEKSGDVLSLGEADGRAYKYLAIEEIRFVIATLDEQAILTVVPTGFDEAQLAKALGISKPRQNLKKSKTLKKIEKKYGFSKYLSGYVDNRRIAGTMLGSATGLDKALLDTMAYETPALDEVCSAEILSMVEIAPRVVFGYEDISTKRIQSSMVVEMRDDIARGLTLLPAIVPGLGMDAEKLISIGFGLSPLALREFFQGRLDAMEADPYECEKLAGLQAGVAKGREMLAQPIPPVAYSFRGVVASFDNLDMMQFGQDDAPPKIDGTILVAMENAESLVMMAAMMDPQIAALNLLPDGKPVSLGGLAHLAGVAGEAFAAMSDSALTVSFGDGAESDAAEILGANGADPAPFFSMSMDSARYYALMGEAMLAEPADEQAQAMPAAIRQAMAEAMTLYGSLYKRMYVDVRFTARGIVIGGNMQLAD